MEEQKDNSCPHRPRKEIDMDKYISMYNDGLSNDQIALNLRYREGHFTGEWKKIV